MGTRSKAGSTDPAEAPAWESDDQELRKWWDAASEPFIRWAERLSAAQARCREADAELKELETRLSVKKKLTAGDRARLGALRKQKTVAESAVHKAEREWDARGWDAQREEYAERRKAWREKHGIPDAVDLPPGWEGPAFEQPIETIQEFLAWLMGQYHVVARLESEKIANPGVAARNAHRLLTELAFKNPGLVEWPTLPPGAARFSAPGEEGAELRRLIGWASSNLRITDAGQRDTALGNAADHERREQRERHAEEPRPTASQPWPASTPESTERKRSWTQTDLDHAIWKYKAERASTYDDLKKGVARGQLGAKKSARKMFGRNAIARALQVKSWAMVSNSRAWQEIAADLRLSGESCRGGPRGQRIGADIALEQQAAASGEAVVDEVIRRETVALVEKAMPADHAVAVVDKLSRGEITDDQARELAKFSVEQQQDSGTQKIRQGL